MSVSVLNNDANLSGKTLVTAEGDRTVTGLLTFDRDPNPPLAVSANSAVVPNLDADKVDGADYATGSWTPALTSAGGGSATYSSQTGTYVKMGAKVWVTGRITLTSKAGFSAGVLTLTGLPFAASGNGGLHASYVANLSTSVSSISGFPQGSTFVLVYFPAAGGTTVSSLTVGDISNTFDIIFTGTYNV